MLGAHVLKTWSSTQPTVSLSSGEAEFYGVVKAAGLALGQQAVMKDLGHEVPVRVWTDSSAAMGICARQGLGKVRHLATHTLWVQEKVRSKAIELRKVRGEVNPADLFTKHLLSRERVEMLVQLFGCEYRGGRAESAPQLRKKKDEGKENEVNVVGGKGKEEEQAGRQEERRDADYADEDDAYYRLFPLHDVDVLPHDHDSADFDQYFPVAQVPDIVDDSEEFDCWKLEKPENELIVKRRRDNADKSSSRRRR